MCIITNQREIHFDGIEAQTKNRCRVTKSAGSLVVFAC